ncbi:MAG: helix-turn-helix transcriptional regulator [Chloroflexi bacterium]|nr:helix-turn-helix transcriptional regulator [Chloroflexota bacterium]
MSVDTDSLDRTLRALSDPTRRRIYEALGRRPGSTTSELATAEPRLSRWAVMKHLAVLRGAGLVQTLPEGRRRRHFRDDRTLAALREWLEAAG